MDRAMPTRAIRLFWRQAGVLLPSLVNEVHRAVRATRPRERRDSVDDRPEFAERVPNLTEHSFAGFPSTHRPMTLDSRTPRGAPDSSLFHAQFLRIRRLGGSRMLARVLIVLATLVVCSASTWADSIELDVSAWATFTATQPCSFNCTETIGMDFLYDPPTSFGAGGEIVLGTLSISSSGFLGMLTAADWTSYSALLQPEPRAWPGG
jgi:hypothetical protein